MKRQRSLFNDIYHVYNGGVGDLTIFRNNEDKDYFCTLISRYAKKYEITIYAYTIMDNHFHMAAKITDFVTFSSFMRDVCAPYGRYYNRTSITMKNGKPKKRHGAVFAEGYKTVPVNNILHTFKLINYIHNNPRPITADPMEYIWSSYMDYMGYYGETVIPKRNFDITVDLAYTSNVSCIEFKELMEYNKDLILNEDELQTDKYMTDSMLLSDMQHIFNISTMDFTGMDPAIRGEWLFKLSQIPGTYIRQISRVTGLSYNDVRTGIKQYRESVTEPSRLESIRKEIIDTYKDYDNFKALIKI